MFFGYFSDDGKLMTYVSEHVDCMELLFAIDTLQEIKDSYREG